MASFYRFIKIGPSPAKWKGLGSQKLPPTVAKLWSEARALPEGYIGPVKTSPYYYPTATYFAQAVPKVH